LSAGSGGIARHQQSVVRASCPQSNARPQRGQRPLFGSRALFGSRNPAARDEAVDRGADGFINGAMKPEGDEEMMPRLADQQNRRRHRDVDFI